MKLLTQELRRKLPPLYSQEHVKDPMVICKFFHPLSTVGKLINLDDEFILRNRRPRFLSTKSVFVFSAVFVFAHSPGIP